jgi:tetratricopeptide (TPR) repeat protein
MRSSVFLFLLTCHTATLAFAADTPEQLLANAQRLERSGNLVEASKLFQQFIKEHPKHTQLLAAHYRLAKCLDGLGQIEESIAQLKVVVQSDQKRFRNRGEAFFMLGKQYAALKDYQRAVAVYEAVLGEGAGLYEDEVLNLSGGWYAVLGKYEEAAAKFNILKGKDGSLLAEDAFYKLAMLWLKVGELDRSVDSVQGLARSYPNNKQIPGLIFRLAQLLREQKKYDESIALCQQLRTGFADSFEAISGRYIVALCYHDQADHSKAVQTLENLTKDGKANRDGLATEAMFLAATIHESDLDDKSGAISRFEQTIQLSRSSRGERTKQVLEQCHFKVGEHHFLNENYGAALEHYVALRALGTGMNVLGRILECQAALDEATAIGAFSTSDIDLIKKKIEENPGTAASAEAEVMLLDRQLNQALKRRGAVPVAIADQYRELLTRYPDSVFASGDLKAYVLGQIGNVYFNGTELKQMQSAIDSFQSALQLLPRNHDTLRVPTLENLALVAERAGQSATAVKAYDELMDISQRRLADKPEDEALQRQTVDYLRSLVTRAETSDLLGSSIAMCQQLADSADQPVLAKEARYYLGELYYMQKNYSAAAKAFETYVRAYGPSQTPAGNLLQKPWQPKKIDDAVKRVHLAQARIAHAWFVQGHHDNMVKTYQWMVENFAQGNPHVAEAQYWLSLELGKLDAEARQSDDARKLAYSRMAEALWTRVVNKSLDFRGDAFPKSFHPWVKQGLGRKHAKAAMLKSGEYFSKAGQSELAARVFEQYLKHFPRYPVDPRTRKPDYSRGPDPMYDIAHYALLREYTTLGEIGRMVNHTEAYIDGLRNSRFRISTLQQVGFHAGKDGRFPAAIRAYATLLDEYGSNDLNDDDKPIPVPVEKRLRQEKLTWNGIREPVPDGLDQGNVRYSLGYWYWQQGFYDRCAEVLDPFLTDEDYQARKVRPQALYMLGKSHWELRNFPAAIPALEVVVQQHADFAATEEVCTLVAEGYIRTQQWGDLALLHQQFVNEWPDSSRRHRMDYCHAVAQKAQDKVSAGVATLEALVAGETYEDVKADACYRLALQAMSGSEPNEARALEYLEQSMSTFVRDFSCLEAARIYMKLKHWEDAERALSRIVNDLPDGDPAIQTEARKLLPTVREELQKAKQQRKSA